MAAATVTATIPAIFIQDEDSLDEDAYEEEDDLNEDGFGEASELTMKDELEEDLEEELTRLHSNCVLLELQLVQATNKLREVDSKTSFKIDTLENELREARIEMEAMASKACRDSSEQLECIQSLSQKLIQQAHIIKKQEKKSNAYRIQLEALRDEVEMQCERDSSRDEEFNELLRNYGQLRAQSLSMQQTLHDNFEEMMELKLEQTKSTARIAELEFALHEKEHKLDQVAKENSEKASAIESLKQNIEEKMKELETAETNLRACEQSVEAMKMAMQSK